MPSVTFRRHDGDEVTDCVLLVHIMDPIGPFIRLEESPIADGHGSGVERQESATTLLQRGPDERAVARYCSPVVKLAAVSLHRVSSFMSSVGLVVNRHYARQVDDQTLDLLLSGWSFSTPVRPHLQPAPSPREL